jgi:magnesium-transporting ATPase (P-type)
VLVHLLLPLMAQRSNQGTEREREKEREREREREIVWNWLSCMEWVFDQGSLSDNFSCWCFCKFLRTLQPRIHQLQSQLEHSPFSSWVQMTNLGFRWLSYWSFLAPLAVFWVGVILFKLAYLQLPSVGFRSRYW